MITFVHLSDIHFRDRKPNTQFDPDQHIRRALIADLKSKPAGSNYDGLLITGDIAFGGKKTEYDLAKVFLEEVYAVSGLSAALTYVIPGNHDVDRDFVKPTFPLWSSHEVLRGSPDPIFWRETLAKQLIEDPLQSLLAPLGKFNDFAQGYACQTTAERLAWSRVFDKQLEDGTLVRLHGLNSALISDEADAPAKLLVSELQTTHFCKDPRTVDLILCHHPPEWLMDKAQLRHALGAFSRISLFGHEHRTDTNVTAAQVQLFAGAVQPAARDPANWLPTYHIVQLSVEGFGDTRVLAVRVHTREFHIEREYNFLPRLNAHSQPIDEHRIQLPNWTMTASLSANSLQNRTAATAVVSEPSGTLPTTDPIPSSAADFAQRELLVNFFRLGSPLRYQVAIEVGLLRDGDDSMDPRSMWEQVFRRAVEEKSLNKFWTAVAKHTPSLGTAQNPFPTN